MAQSLKTVRTVRELRRHTAKWRDKGQSIALVATMGALHDGHISLVKRARKKADRVVVSIFVNPTQFGPTEDLSRYPRDEAGDLAKLADAGVDLVWSPDVSEMYPEGFSTRIEPGSAARDLEGAFRPHHFGGVATVCCKLFSQVSPDVAVFGEKDFQQLTVLRQMVRDLNLPLQLVAAPTKRAKDGLALSSRNAYLSEKERAIAPDLYKALTGLADELATGGDVAAATAKTEAALLASGFTKIDYIAVRDAESFAAQARAVPGQSRLLAAAWLGSTRLIDNVPIG